MHCLITFNVNYIAFKAYVSSVHPWNEPIASNCSRAGVSNIRPTKVSNDLNYNIKKKRDALVHCFFMFILVNLYSGFTNKVLCNNFPKFYLCGKFTKSVKRSLTQARAEHGHKEKRRRENTAPCTSSLFAKYGKNNINIKLGLIWMYIWRELSLEMF